MPVRHRHRISVEDHSWPLHLPLASCSHEADMRLPASMVHSHNSSSADTSRAIGASCKRQHGRSRRQQQRSWTELATATLDAGWRPAAQTVTSSPSDELLTTLSSVMAWLQRTITSAPRDASPGSRTGSAAPTIGAQSASKDHEAAS